MQLCTTPIIPFKSCHIFSNVILFVIFNKIQLPVTN